MPLDAVRSPRIYLSRTVQIFEQFEIIGGKRLGSPWKIKADLEHSCYVTELLLQLRKADLVHIFVMEESDLNRNCENGLIGNSQPSASSVIRRTMNCLP